MFKVNNKNTTMRVWDIFKTNKEKQELSFSCHSNVFAVNFEHISHLVLFRI